MMDHKMSCPACRGAGTVGAFCNKGAESSVHNGPINCFRCRGEGRVPAAMLQWMQRGRELAARRRLAGHTLLTGAESLGLSTSQLSAIENGRVAPPDESAQWWGPHV